VGYQITSGRSIAVSERPLSLYHIGTFLDPLGARLLRSYEVQRMVADGFLFGELDIAGVFWTATKVSCSLNLAWRITEGGSAEMVVGGWDKTFYGWGVGVPK